MQRGAAFEVAERAVQGSVQWLRRAIETTGALIVAIGIVIALWPEGLAGRESRIACARTEEAARPCLLRRCVCRVT
jgi:hypothetical protein